MPSHPMPVACRSCSLRHFLPTFSRPVTVRLRRRATGERRVRCSGFATLVRGLR